jgi:hypothetical protein
MINFVVTKHHRYTLKKLLNGALGELKFKHRLWTYESLLKSRIVKTGTWIFQDIERLTFAERVQASQIASRLECHESRILNHPAKAAARYELLRKLFNAGINSFQSYRADEHRIPDQWPVFIRYEHNHRSPNSTLFQNYNDLKKALEEYTKQAVPLSALLIIEYCGEQKYDNLWRKYSSFRVGNEIINHHIIIEDNWIAKYGNPDARYENDAWLKIRQEEKAFVDEIDDKMNLMSAFELGGIEFGRMDFGIVKTMPQVYEINTNPTIGVIDPKKEKFPTYPRAPIIAMANQRIVDALQRQDFKGGNKVNISDINFISSIPWRPKKRP